MLQSADLLLLPTDTHVDPDAHPDSSPQPMVFDEQTGSCKPKEEVPECVNYGEYEDYEE